MKAPVTIKSSLKIGYSVLNKGQRHEWFADEPIEAGGLDEGPRPTEIFLSSLASCKLITVRMYAERKEWDLKDANITLTLHRNPNETYIEKKIEFIGDLTDEQRKRLLDISGRCPVVKLIDPAITFRIVE